MLPSAVELCTPPILELSDIPYATCLVRPHPDLRWLKARLSICTFHWKTEAERKREGIAITVSLDVLKRGALREFSMLDFFLLETATNTADVFKKGDLHPNDGLPRLVHCGHPKSTIALDPQPNTWSIARPPSQAGLSVIMSYDRALDRIVWVLATVSCGKEVVFRELDMPHVASLKAEFYSGALCSVTNDAKSVVIQYLD
ncbi:hypothetical protein DFH11DRAFT_1085674 [Phellopilus nigrolimitatus]|nr:hypothetical protein DFH11DRAFT_1085674 [Phellopilus nigrolimitatus]